MDSKITLRQQIVELAMKQKEGIVDTEMLSAKIYTSLPNIVRAILDEAMQIIR